jgi:glycosyltransferase involved in cell wall biosynthesis
MKVLIACDSFTMGGADIVALRTAKALRDKGCDVYLYAVYSHRIDPELVKYHAPEIPIITCIPNGLINWLVNRIDGICKRVRFDFKLRELLIAWHFKREVRLLGIGVVHNHLFFADYVSTIALKNVPIPIVATMHGAHEGYLADFIKNKNSSTIQNYPSKLKKVLQRLDGIAYNTNRNLHILNSGLIPQQSYQHLILRKIYYGFAGNPITSEYLSRETLHIKASDTVFGMVARGIPEKGWMPAIESFLQLNDPNAHLILVGSSSYLDELKTVYSQQDNIHFVGQAKDPLKWIRMFDVGLLPTIYGESLPNSIIEYLSCSKPVITTNIAECPHMIEVDGEKAGFVLKVKTDEAGFALPESRIDINQFTLHLKRYTDDSTLRQKHSILAFKAFEKFSMNQIVDAYLDLYQQVQVKYQ